MTDNQESFSMEFEKLSANIDQVHERLFYAVNNVMDEETVGD